MKKIYLLILSSFLLFGFKKKEILPAYKDSSLEINERVDDLLSRMTTEEKFWQLFMLAGDLSEGKEKYKHGIFGFQVHTKISTDKGVDQILDYSGGGTVIETAKRANEIQKFFVEETRLGIPIILFDESLHGLVRKDATVFPQAIGLAASWNTNLMDTVALAIAREVKERGIRQVLSPVLNISRDPRWGRTEETYGEDPFLTTKMALSYISTLENYGIITTPKHFVANVGDGGRDSYPIHFNERLLEEIYFPAFKACVQEANAWSIMTAYNSIDGEPASANDWLLNKKLKQEWGFDGFVISDASSLPLFNPLHATAKNNAEAGKQSFENGLDVIFEVSYDIYPSFYEAFEKDMVDEKAIDEAVRRVLYAKFKLGLFENPYVEIPKSVSKKQIAKHRKLTKQAALESVVLLKNNEKLLPLSKAIKSIAVIGSEANEVRFGGYSGPGNNPVSILQGIKNKIGDQVKVSYTLGAERFPQEFVAVPENHLFHYENGKKEPGLKAEYFNNINMEGEPALSRIDKRIYFGWTLYSPDKDIIDYDYFSARWTGKITAPKTGNIDLGIRGDDGYRIYINNELVIDNWKKQSAGRITKPFFFEKGKEYDLKVEFYESVGNVICAFEWNAGVKNNWKSEIAKAVNLTKSSDVAVVCVGIEEGEFRDRAYLSLPGHQEELIKEVAKTGKPVVVLLVGGSAITMQNWINDVPAILDVWYPGDEGGNAIADVLFGDYNPAGRLPITFPIHEAQLPLYYNHKPTGRGDNYLNLTGKPLFPFGYGLSYTNFTYSNLRLDKSTIANTESTVLRVDITNTGDYDGDEVVQLYIKDEIASVSRPVMELKGFQRINLKKGETKEVSFELTPELLKMLNKQMQWVVEPGTFRLMVGTSSNDIRLKEVLRVE